MVKSGTKMEAWSQNQSGEQHSTGEDWTNATSECQNKKLPARLQQIVLLLQQDVLKNIKQLCGWIVFHSHLKDVSSFAAKGVVLPKILPYNYTTKKRKKYYEVRINTHYLHYLFFPKIRLLTCEKRRVSQERSETFLGGSHFKTTGSPSAAGARASGRRSIPREFSDRLDVVWSGCLECKSHPWLISGWGAACVWMCSWGQFPHNHSEWIFLAR